MGGLPGVGEEVVAHVAREPSIPGGAHRGAQAFADVAQGAGARVGHSVRVSGEDRPMDSCQRPLDLVGAPPENALVVLVVDDEQPAHPVREDPHLRLGRPRVTVRRQHRGLHRRQARQRIVAVDEPVMAGPGFGMRLRRVDEAADFGGDVPEAARKMQSRRRLERSAVAGAGPWSVERRVPLVGTRRRGVAVDVCWGDARCRGGSSHRGRFGGSGVGGSGRGLARERPLDEAVGLVDGPCPKGRTKREAMRRRSQTVRKFARAEGRASSKMPHGRARAAWHAKGSCGKRIAPARTLEVRDRHRPGSASSMRTPAGIGVMPTG